MNRSVSCTMKVPKGDLVTYAPNGQVKCSSPHSFIANLVEEKLPGFIIHYIIFVILCVLHNVLRLMYLGSRGIHDPEPGDILILLPTVISVIIPINSVNWNLLTNFNKGGKF